jgi:hypothetical protein
MKAINITTGCTVYIAPYQDGKVWVSETEDDFKRCMGRCDYAENYKPA